MDYTRILYEKVEPEIVKIIMNRPEKRNAQDSLMSSEMTDAFTEADLDEEVRVIIFAGAGKDFSAGHDLSDRGEEARGPIIGKAMATISLIPPFLCILPFPVFINFFMPFIIHIIMYISQGLWHYIFRKK